MLSWDEICWCDLLYFSYAIPCVGKNAIAMLYDYGLVGAYDTPYNYCATNKLFLANDTLKIMFAVVIEHSTLTSRPKQTVSARYPFHTRNAMHQLRSNFIQLGEVY